MASLDQDVKNQLKEVNDMLVGVDDFFGNLEEKDYDELTSNMTPVEKAQYDITIAYAYNSLFWMYKRSMGDDPNQHKIKEELDRIKAQMLRLHQIKDKSKRPKVNAEAAGRMIRHGINSHDQSKGKRKRVKEEENWDDDGKSK